MRVGVVGHVEWVDFISVQRLPRAGQIEHAEFSFARAAGGGGVAATVLAELGAEVDFFCALGRDGYGRAARRQLSRRGVRVHAAWRSEPTRRAVTILETGGERTIVTIGNRLQPAGSDKLGWGRLRDADAVYFTAGDAAALGLARRSPVLVVSPRAHEALEEPAQRADGRLSLGHDRPRGEKLIDALVFSAHDRHESEWARAISSDARLIVATEGAEGGRWRGVSHGRWRALKPRGEPRDSYGCGDSFAAGFTFGLAAGKSVAQAARVGAGAGVRCLTRVGAP
jgi:ribokinase